MNPKYSSAHIFLSIRAKNTQGFSLVEVMIGILLIAVFVGAAMQTLVAATAIKVKAQERSEGAVWIQEDIEQVRYQANQLPANKTLCSATDATAGYADALRDAVVGTTSTTSTTTNTFTKTSNVSPRTYTLTRVISFKNVNVMQLNYTVTPSSDSSVLARSHVEVIPDQALQCS
jgi:prepilin-type N-terminal cleavage/methylation domain-containing protein